MGKSRAFKDALKSMSENRREGICWAPGRCGWEKAIGPVTVSDLTVGEKTSVMWRKTQANMDLGHQKEKARRNLREVQRGSGSGADLEWKSVT